jgi:hypothetical protein
MNARPAFCTPEIKLLPPVSFAETRVTIKDFETREKGAISKELQLGAGSGKFINSDKAL